MSAPREVAVRLGLDDGAPVVLRRRVFLLEGEPTALVDSYYPAEWANGTAIEEPDRIMGGVYALIEDPDGPIRRQIAASECRYRPSKRPELAHDHGFSVTANL